MRATSVEPSKPVVDIAYVSLAIGLTTIFLANAIGAVVAPASYEHILDSSAITQWVGLDRYSWVVTLIAVNDAAIAVGLTLALITRRLQRPAITAAGLWLAMAAVLKLTACFGGA